MNQNSQWTQEKWQQTTAALMRRASTDAAFRQKCLSDPRGAIKEVSGLDMHPNAKIRFSEPAEGLVLTLPPLRTSAELSDKELERVSGAGGTWSWLLNYC
ncbi:MAG: NHLP leader peptide family natural product precursor [Verrucomicrobiota bacterium]